MYQKVGKILLTTIDEVKRVVSASSKIFHLQLKFYGSDQSKGIKTMLNSLQNNVIAAIILVLIIILGALGVRLITSWSLHTGILFIRFISSFVMVLLLTLLCFLH